ncbi:hypothetical protein CSB37_01075 [bacterium DOLZORAL124_38_8]|nr:MAG: hypothetical protein CSB37_01075 [bacterium DOLZORAL124_38_8]
MNNHTTKIFGGKISPNTWYFIVASYDGQKARLWIDGDLQAEKIAPLTTHFTKGPYYSLGDGSFYGSLDDVMLIPYGYDGEKFY